MAEEEHVKAAEGTGVRMPPHKAAAAMTRC